MLNYKAQWQTALLLTHRETIRAKEHQFAMAVAPKSKKRGNERSMEAWNGMGFSAVFLASRTGPDRHTCDAWIFSFKPATDISKTSQLTKWSYAIS